MSAAERWIPFRLRDLVDILATESSEPERFRELHRIVAAVVHHEYRQELERLKDAYAPFNPDADHRVIRTWSDDERTECQRVLVAALTDLVEAANYEAVGREVLGGAVEGESLLKLRLHVDLDDFDEILFFRRGLSRRTEEVSHLFGLRHKPVEFTNCARILIYLKFRDAEHFEAAGRRDLPFEPGSTIIKLFQDVPRADLEMLLPNTEVRMRTTDKLVIGVPALLSGLVVLVTKVASSLGLLVLLVLFWVGVRDDEVDIGQTQLAAIALGLGSLLAFGWRQWTKFKNRRIQFMKTLSENLYFRNLDNDVGVFHHLLDAAAEEEIKEILLALHFLTDGPETADGLDERIEAWSAEHLDCVFDFDVRDALDKLGDLGLIEVRDDEHHAVSLDEARRRLDQRWDAYFAAPALPR
ncbi:TMEM143 family protein [Iamia sp.]|uniref:TMEM143 family protein n=1 Tax=Iamia sp. TaxID=2722710 RepID=UPI002C8B6EF4|nr:TMEM143 family protein [Iamia sp.]HXH56929.1 TMEM143 family protein [Iamia sp.]